MCRNNGRLITAFREQAGISRNNLADRLGVPRGEFKALEAGKAEQRDRLTDHNFVTNAIKTCLS